MRISQHPFARCIVSDARKVVLFGSLVLLTAGILPAQAVERLFPNSSDKKTSEFENGYEWYVYDGNKLGYVRYCHWVPVPIEGDPDRMCWNYDPVAGSFKIPHVVTGYIGNTLVSRTIDTVRYASPGVSAFSELSSVEVSDGITSLEAAFTYCNLLTEVKLPSSLTTMVGAFNACTALSTLTIPDSVTEIGDSCFNECSNLVSVSWPVSLEKIGDDAFRRCSVFSSVELPDGCREIGYRAFVSCSSLTNLSLGRCERIGESAFQSCAALEHLSIPDSMTNIAKSAFAGCSGLVDIEFPATLKSIGTTAFEGCSSLRSIRIPDGVETIGINAFKNCKSVSELFIPTSVSDANSSFVGVNPYELTEGTLWASVGLANVTNFTLLPGATTFGGLRYQTQYATNIQRIELPDTVTTLGKSAISGYTNLTELVLPSTITSVGDMAFSNCDKLKVFPLLEAGVTNWGKSVYWGCSGVEKLVVPGSIKSIPDSMFRECTGLKELVIEEGVESVAGTAFMGDVNLEYITVGSTVTNLLFASYRGPDASKVKVATFYQLHPPKYVVKAFLQNFNGKVYYPPAFADEWAAVLDDAGIVDHQAWSTDPEPPTPPVKTVVKIAKPTAAEALVYSGEAQFGIVDGDDRLSFVGDLVATNAGAYSVSFTLPMGSETETYVWTDGGTGCCLIEWGIAPLDINDEDVTFGAIDSQIATGEEIKPTVTMTFGEQPCVVGEDYTVAYADNIEVGTGRATVTGKGNFMGSRTLEFAIVAPEPSMFTVTFDACGGSVEESARQVADGEPLGELPVAVREGYEFVGWFVTDGEEIREVSSADIVTGDVTIQAHWTEIVEIPTYTVIVGAKCSVDVGLKGQGYVTKTLPKGLSYSDKTGLVTGTCKTATDDDGVTVTFTKKGAEDIVMIFIARAENTPTVTSEGLAAGTFTVGVRGGALGDRALPSIPLDIGAESGVKSVIAKDLPVGMKLVQDKTTKAWSITGVPTKAGAYEVAITVTTVAGNKTVEVFKVEVAALPTGATGTFNGFVFVDATASSRQEVEGSSSERRGEDAASTGGTLNCGTVQVTVSEVGKITAKVVSLVSYSFAADGWDSVKDGVYSVTMTTKKGEVLSLACDANAAWNAKQMTGTFAAGGAAGVRALPTTEASEGGAQGLSALPVEAQKNAFGKQWFFNAVGDETKGWTLSFAENAKAAALTVTLNADGKTTVAGTLYGTPVTSGKKTTTPAYKVSASGYVDVSGIEAGALYADFAPVITVGKTKMILSLRANLWFDKTNTHEEGVGSAVFVW